MSGERDRPDKSKINAQVRHVPKDAQVVMSILKDLGVRDYEQRVINQILEFAYRYVTCILDDAKVFANHARKKTIELEDVKLATEVAIDKTFTNPPPRHVISKMAEARNAMPLPAVKPLCGLRLPPDRYCLSSCNYKLRAVHLPKKMTKSALDGVGGGRSAQRNSSKQSAAGSAGGQQIPRQTIGANKSQVVTIPKPIIKFSTNSKNLAPTTSTTSAAPVPIATPSTEKTLPANVTVPEVNMEVELHSTGNTSTIATESQAEIKTENRTEEEFHMA